MGSGRNIIYLGDLSHDTIAQKTGPKRFNESDKKLSRILKEGGTVVIDVDKCDPKQLLTFNSVEWGVADSTLNGIGDRTIKVNEKCTFIFVGKTINKQQLDFISRGNWAMLEDLQSLIQPIVQVRKEQLTVTITSESNPQENRSTAVVDVQNRPPEEWKGWLKQGFIKYSNAQHPHMVALQDKKTLVLRGASPGFKDSGITDSLAKFLSKRGITNVVIVKDTQPKEQQAVPFNSKKNTVFANKETLFQLLNSPVVGTDGRLSVGNALSNFKNSLQLVITEPLAPQDWYQLRQLDNIIVYKGKDVDGPEDFQTADSDNSLNVSKQESINSQSINRKSLVMGHQEYIQSDEFTPKKASDPSKKSQNKISFSWLFRCFLSSQQKYEDSKSDEITSTLLGQFDQKPHGLVSKMKSGETIVVYVPDAKNPPESLRPLLGSSPWAILNGELTLLTGRVVLKSSSDLPAKTAEENKPNALKIYNLESHGESYLTCVQSQLGTHRYVAVHGDAACGKSHLSRKLNNTCFLGDIGQSTNANDIQADPAFREWLEHGKNNESVLVIDEYNLAETGVFNCLKGTHINLNGELIQLTDNHKVLFLGNKATETGRNNHHNLIDSIVTMQSPNPEWVVDYCSSLEITQELKNQLITKVKEGASIRDIQTFFAMYQLNQETAFESVFKPEINLSDLTRTVQYFLDYVAQKPTGNRVLYITGEPGCGKDHSIKEALGEKNIQYECVTLGQHMDIDQFKQMFDTAYTDGTVLVVSELSAAPSAVLEYMNGKLAQPADNEFCLIATDNAGFEGREPLSGPLRSRCVLKTIQPVTRKEFDELFKDLYSKDLVDFHFSLMPSTASLRQLHRASNLLNSFSDKKLVSVISDVYGETLAAQFNEFINAQQPPQDGAQPQASSSGLSGAQQPPQAGAQQPPQMVSSGLSSLLSSIDPKKRDLYVETTPTGKPSITGSCASVKNGFIIETVYDSSGNQEPSIKPCIASSDNSPIPNEATITSKTQTIDYSVVKQQKPVDSDVQSLESLLDLNIQNQDEYAKKVAGFISTYYTYSVDLKTKNSVKTVLKALTTNNREEFTQDLNTVKSMDCDTATLLFMKIMTHKFPNSNIYYGEGFCIIEGNVSGTGHAQPTWITNDGTTTISPTPVNLSNDTASKEVAEQHKKLFNQSQAGSSGSSGAQPQARSNEVKNKWEKALDDAKQKSSGPKVVHAASCSLNIDQTISQARPVFGGKRLSEQDIYALELKVIKNIYFTDFEGAPDELKSNEKFMIKAVGVNPYIIQYASDTIRNNKAVVLAAVQQDVWALEYASEELRGDSDVVMAAVKNSGFALNCASAELKNNKSVVMAAVKKNGSALEYASEELRGYSDVVMAAVKKNGWALSYASEDLRGDKSVVMAAVKNYGFALQDASEELRGDSDVVMAAVKHYGSALRYASAETKADRAVVLAAVKKNGEALRHASDALKADRDVVLEAVKQNSSALRYASDDLKNDKDIIAAQGRRHTDQ